VTIAGGQTADDDFLLVRRHDKQTPDLSHLHEAKTWQCSMTGLDVRQQTTGSPSVERQYIPSLGYQYEQQTS